MRFNRKAIALTLVVAAGATFAQATPENLTSADWRSAAAAIVSSPVRRPDTGEMTRSGVEIPWRGTSGGGEIIFQPIVSRGTDQICDGACADPCRRFNMSYEQGGYRARYAGMVCAIDASMRTWTLTGEPQFVSSQGQRPDESVRIASAAQGPAPAPALVPPPPATAQPSVASPDAAELAANTATNSQSPIAANPQAALRRRLTKAFLALAYMTPDDARPQERAYRAGRRAFIQDERLEEDAPLDALVARAEAAMARSEAAEHGDCNSPVQAAVIVCVRRS